jgi:hypothetical protein
MKIRKIRINFLFLLLILFAFFLYIILKPYSYNKKYILDGYHIIEKYNKKGKYYKFEIRYNGTVYTFLLENKYIRNKEIINKIEYKKSTSEECIIPKSEYMKFYPLCSNDKELYSYNLTNIDMDYKYQKIKSSNTKYDNIRINYLNNKNFLLYNYKGFNYINGKSNKNIKLFKNDVYTISLVYQFNNYLIVADYNQNHYFNKLFIININNGRLKEIKSEYDISFNSVFLGEYKNKIYLLDNKEQKEYVIDIKKNTIKETEYATLIKNKLVKCDFNEIKVFYVDKIYNYEIADDYLYLEAINKIRLSNNKINKIIKNDGNTIYYLSEDNLYMFNNIYGEVLLINNFEWNFNDTNMIYLS